MTPVDPEVRRQVLKRCKGTCERCKAGCGHVVRRLADGRWARWSHARGGWWDGRGVSVHAIDTVGRSEEVVRLEVVTAGPDAHIRIAGRVVALCQMCAHAATTPPPAPAARQETLGL